MFAKRFEMTNGVLTSSSCNSFEKMELICRFLRADVVFDDVWIDKMRLNFEEAPSVNQNGLFSSIWTWDQKVIRSVWHGIFLTDSLATRINSRKSYFSKPNTALGISSQDLQDYYWWREEEDSQKNEVSQMWRLKAFSGPVSEVAVHVISFLLKFLMMA